MTTFCFTKDFDYREDDLLTIAYKAGHVIEVSEDCATKALAAGVGEIVKNDDHE